MKISALKNKISPYYKNLLGWRTNRKIVVFESDDWGSIRMPSQDIYKKCLKAGYRVDKNPYERFDSLASEEDLELLFDVLTSFKDSRSNHPTITANTLTSNPDFFKIKATDYNEYFYELITETFKRYPKHSNCVNLWKEGTSEGFFFLQSHGREHLNVTQWMNDLQTGEENVLLGFGFGMPGLIPNGLKNGTSNKYIEALRYLNPVDKLEKLSIVAEGLDLFEKLFGYRSETFIPNNYLWSPDFDEVISKKGVRFYQGNRKMKEIQFEGSNKYHTYRLGEINSYGQRYLVRNAAFEPSMSLFNREHEVEKCLYQISAAFKMKKPAIVCSHRVNYVGFIDETNRDINLKMFKNLLKEINKKWPDVIYLNSVDLGHLIMNDIPSK